MPRVHVFDNLPDALYFYPLFSLLYLLSSSLEGFDSLGKSVILSALLRSRNALGFEMEKDCLILTR